MPLGQEQKYYLVELTKRRPMSGKYYAPPAPQSPNSDRRDLKESDGWWAVRQQAPQHRRQRADEMLSTR